MSYISARNLRFILHEVLDLDSIRQFERFQDFDQEAIDFSLDAAQQLADQYLHPVYQEMDKNKAYFQDGEVHVLPEVGEGMRAMGEAGWLSANWDYEHNGQQMPLTVHNAGGLIFQAANGNLAAYGFLTTGAANLIREFGSDTLKDIYLKPMAEGRWQGTMALTEPQAGSSLSDITSTYEEQADGTYLIHGQKIYISGGDHTAVDNVVHLLLARKKGGPKGTKGVSLFVVPKHVPEGDDLTDNNVTTAGIYGKMGQKGYVAAHLMYGEQGPTRGFLVGQEFSGLKHMFLMMNEARIGTGMMAAGSASAAYYASLKYANERPQGRHPGNKDINAPQVTIIEHADVRRMLFFQKAVVEGSIHLLLQCSLYEDHYRANGDERSHLLLELLTPIAKSFPAEYGNEAVSIGMQVLGGAGYTDDFPLEQIFRDIRVNSIYEGTTTIHGLDLLGRKVMMQNGQAVRYLKEEMLAAIKAASAQPAIAELATALGKSLQGLQEVMAQLLQLAREEDPKVFLADATVFLDYFGLHVIAWSWLQQATVATRALESAMTVGKDPLGEEDQRFYQSKVQTARYFFTYVFSRTAGLRRTLLAQERITLDTEAALLV
ncbi:3-methylmercaptopropionyl-CoA dehydrogenase [Neolewinella maritima]|uniref:3-methylmercaptopropionyl-CoA dehydrogenase n=1 Tax=Neolewinella maritima TaxID=1383882 RepID=A0ABM9B0V0_9BACT|nr:acyl-CoA dehydrogenase [Neolewinella maritima]CAH1000408.1 3-methylmercaptopropionyl-CoA dehydrogenase [Neolewinella maritima]